MAIPSDKDDLMAGSVCASFDLESSPNAFSICNQAQGLAVAGRWDEAQGLASRLKNLLPHHGIGFFWSGLIDFKQGRHIASVRQFETAVDLSPNAVPAHEQLGLGYLSINQFKLFEDEMRWVMITRPQDSLPYYYLGRYVAKNLEQLDKGIELFQQALAKNPNDYRSRYHLGYLFELKGDLEKAKAEYQASLSASQKGAYAWPLQGLSSISLKKDNLLEAIRYAEQAASLDPKLASNRLNLGKLYIQNGELLKGIAELKAASEIEPADAAPHYLLSRAYLSLKQTAEAQHEQEIFLQIKTVYGSE